MAQVYMPQQQKSDPLGKALMVASVIPAPAPVAGPVSVAKGLSEKPQQAVPIVQSDPAAIQRRMQKLDEAGQALSYLPPQQQQQFGPAIKRARMMAEQEAYA